jgi:hypothetical protein
MIRNRGTWIEFGFEKKLFYVTKRKHAQGSKKKRERREEKERKKKLMAGDTLEVHRVDMLS